MPSVNRRVFGLLDGRDVFSTTLSAGKMTVEVLDYGAIVRSVRLEADDGTSVDVVLGLDDLDAYRHCTTFFGAICGRVANRIADARFSLGGRTFELEANDPPHHLHGGPRGYDKVVWTSAADSGPDGAWVRLDHSSPDGDAGYPGQVNASVVYRITSTGAFVVEMTATSTELTPVSLAHHSYWNLGGHDAGSLADHTLELHADEVTLGSPVVPDGRVTPVVGTVFDLRKPTRLDALERVPGSPPGYDHNFVVKGVQNQERPVCDLVHVPSGRRLSLAANQPGVQIYTGNFLDSSLRGKGATYGRHGAICLETQAFPNAINVPAWQGQVLLERGAAYRHTMVHQFSWR